MINPFKSTTEAGLDITLREDGTLLVQVDGLKIQSASIGELNEVPKQNPIHNQTMKRIYDTELTLRGVNYNVAHPEQFEAFIQKEVQRLIPEIESLTGRTIDLPNLKPDEWVFLSAKICEANLTYNYIAYDGDGTKKNTEGKRKKGTKLTPCLLTCSLCITTRSSVGITPQQ